MKFLVKSLIFRFTLIFNIGMAPVFPHFATASNLESETEPSEPLDQEIQLLDSLINFEQDDVFNKDIELTENALLIALKIEREYDFLLEYLQGLQKRVDHPSQNYTTISQDEWNYGLNRLKVGLRQIEGLINEKVVFNMDILNTLVAKHFSSMRLLIYLNEALPKTAKISPMEFAELHSPQLTSKGIQLLWPSRNAIPSDVQIHFIGSSLEFKIKMPASLVIAEVQRFRATNPKNKEDFWILAKCMGASATLQNLADINKLRLQPNTPLTNNISNQLCLGFENTTLEHAAKSSVIYGLSEDNFRTLMLIPFNSLEGNMSESLLEQLYNTNLVVTTYIEEKPTSTTVPTILYGPNLYLEPESYTDNSNYFPGQSVLSLQQFQSLQNSYASSLDLIHSRRSYEARRFHQVLLNETVFSALHTLLNDPRMSSRRDLRDEKKLRSYLTDAETLLWEQAFNYVVELSPLPLEQINDSNPELFKQVLKEIFTKSKKLLLERILNYLFTVSVRSGVSLDPQSLAKNFYLMYLDSSFPEDTPPPSQKNTKNSPQNNKIIDENIITGVVNEYLTLISKESPKALNIESDRKAYLLDMMKNSVVANEVMTTQDLSKIAFTDVVFLAALTPVLQSMDPLVQDWIRSIVHNSSSFEEKAKMADEAKTLLINQLKSNGVQYYGNCPNRADTLDVVKGVLHHLFIFGPISDWFSSKNNSEEKYKKNLNESILYAKCDMDKLSRYFGYTKPTEPKSLQDIKDELDQDFPENSSLAISSNKIIQRYREIIRSVLFINFRPMEVRLSEMNAKSEGDEYLYQVLSRFSNNLTKSNETKNGQITNVDLQTIIQHDGQVLERAESFMNRALSVSAENAQSLLLQFANSSKPEEMSHFLTASYFIPGTLGKDHLSDHLTSEQRALITGEQSSDYEVYPRALKIYDEIVLDVMSRRNSNEEIYDTFFSNSMSPWQMILTFALVRFTLGKMSPGLGGMLSSIAANRRVAFNIYLGFTVSLFATDSLIMVNQRIPRWQKDLETFERLSLSEARTNETYPALFKADNYLISKTLATEELNEITKFNWNPIGIFTGAWGRIASNLFFVSLPVLFTTGGFAYSKIWAPKRMRKMENTLKSLDEKIDLTTVDKNLVLKIQKDVSNQYEKMYYANKESFRALKIEHQPSWDPRALKSALDVIKTSGASSTEIIRAEIAYQKLIRALSEDFSRFSSLVNKSGEVVEEGYSTYLRYHMQSIFPKQSNSELQRILRTINTEMDIIRKGSNL